MSKSMIGRKCGMTRVFTEDGASIPVTVLEMVPNRITQCKNKENDGYNAIQITAGSRKSKHIVKPLAGHFAKAQVEAGDVLMEFRVEDSSTYKFGDELKIDMFEAGQLVDVTGQSKGKGFAGTIKRWNFRGQDNTHGNSVSHRVPGSIGQCQTPGRVFKGKKMSGHMGDEKVTVQSLEVVRVDVERNLLLVKGAVPGATGSNIVVRSAVKAKA